MALKSIKVKNYSDVFEEYDAGGTITPGMFVEVESDGDVVAHNSAGDFILPMVAIEDAFQGNDIDDDYASGAKVMCWIPTRGDQVLAILADGEEASIGSLLCSNGDGKLKVQDSAGEAVVGVALEAVDMSDSSAADPTGRIVVRIN